MVNYFVCVLISNVALCLHIGDGCLCGYMAIFLIYMEQNKLVKIANEVYIFLAVTEGAFYGLCMLPFTDGNCAILSPVPTIFLIFVGCSRSPESRLSIYDFRILMIVLKRVFLLPLSFLPPVLLLVPGVR